MASGSAKGSVRFLERIEKEKAELEKAKANAVQFQKDRADAEKALDAAALECARVDNSATKKAYNLAKKTLETADDNRRIGEAKISVVQSEIDGLTEKHARARCAEIPGEMKASIAEWQSLAKQVHDKLAEIRDIQVELCRNRGYRGALDREREKLTQAGREVADPGVHARALNNEVDGGPLETFLAKLIREFQGQYAQGFEIEPVGFWRSGITR